MLLIPFPVRQLLSHALDCLCSRNFIDHLLMLYGGRWLKVHSKLLDCLSVSSHSLTNLMTDNEDGHTAPT